GPLTDPTAHGGRAEDAFHLVLPSVPGYAFSAEPTELGWYAGRVAEAWGKLMPRLGYTRYVAQGGDVGATVTDAMGRQAPEWLTGTGASAARSYWESEQATARAAGQAPPPVSLPVGFTTFPGEIVATPRSWVEKGHCVS